jgi:hypothetical protein
MKLPTKPINQETFWDEIGKPILWMLLVNWGVIALLIFHHLHWKIIHSWQASQQGV